MRIPLVFLLLGPLLAGCASASNAPGQREAYEPLSALEPCPGTIDPCVFFADGTTMSIRFDGKVPTPDDGTRTGMLYSDEMRVFFSAATTVTETTLTFHCGDSSTEKQLVIHALKGDLGTASLSIGEFSVTGSVLRKGNVYQTRIRPVVEGEWYAYAATLPEPNSAVRLSQHDNFLLFNKRHESYLDERRPQDCFLSGGVIADDGKFIVAYPRVKNASYSLRGQFDHTLSSATATQIIRKNTNSLGMTGREGVVTYPSLWKFLP